jgi:hypothetical protein
VDNERTMGTTVRPAPPTRARRPVTSNCDHQARNRPKGDAWTCGTCRPRIDPPTVRERRDEGQTAAWAALRRTGFGAGWPKSEPSGVGPPRTEPWAGRSAAKAMRHADEAPIGQALPVQIRRKPVDDGLIRVPGVVSVPRHRGSSWTGPPWRQQVRRRPPRVRTCCG